MDNIGGDKGVPAWQFVCIFLAFQGPEAFFASVIKIRVPHPEVPRHSQDVSKKDLRNETDRQHGQDRVKTESEQGTDRVQTLTFKGSKCIKSSAMVHGLKIPICINGYFL